MLFLRQRDLSLKGWAGFFVMRQNFWVRRFLMGYLDSYGLDTGYLLSFSFNKMKNPGVEKINIGDKTIYQGIV